VSLVCHVILYCMSCANYASKRKQALSGACAGPIMTKGNSLCKTTESLDFLV
jgi:hypothetical protein